VSRPGDSGGFVGVSAGLTETVTCSVVSLFCLSRCEVVDAFEAALADQQRQREEALLTVDDEGDARSALASGSSKNQRSEEVRLGIGLLSVERETCHVVEERAPAWREPLVLLRVRPIRHSHFVAVVVSNDQNLWIGTGGVT
jgi:hypothetical protein